jgi:hypothetical protein
MTANRPPPMASQGTQGEEQHEGRGTWREPSPDPPAQPLEPFLEAALLGPVALADRLGEGEREHVASRKKRN